MSPESIIATTTGDPKSFPTVNVSFLVTTAATARTAASSASSPRNTSSRKCSYDGGRSQRPRCSDPHATRAYKPCATYFVQRAPCLSSCPVSFAGSAPLRGRNFCARPLNTSATYRLFSWSTENWCTPFRRPGSVPNVPQPYRNFPLRSYFSILCVSPSDTQRNSSRLIST